MTPDYRCAVLLTGKPAAGKTTLAHALADYFNADSYFGAPWRVIDADEIRPQFWPHLGHSHDDRLANLAGLTYLAKGVLGTGSNVLLSCVSPYAFMRQWILQVLSYSKDLPISLPTFTFLVWVDAPLRTLQERDPKGLYRLQAEGKLQGLTGVDASYEAPDGAAEPHLLVRTEGRKVSDCVALCSTYLKKQTYVRLATRALDRAMEKREHGTSSTPTD